MKCSRMSAKIPKQIPKQLLNPDLRFLCIEKSVPGDPLSGKRPQQGKSWKKQGKNANIILLIRPD